MNIFVKVAVGISGVFYLYFLMNIILVNHYREPTEKYTKGQQPYKLFLVIPVLNEEHVITRTIDRLSAELSQLPKSIQAQIVAVDDNSGDHSLLALTSSKSPYLQVLHRAGNDELGKGAVLNTAVDYIYHTLAVNFDPTKTIIGVFDADAFMTQPDLAHAVARFEHDSELTMLQTGVGIYNRGTWLTQMQNFEFMGVNNATQQLRNRLGQGIASGNGQFVRLDLARKNPWGNSLLEDLEFTIRTWLIGGKTGFDHTLVVQQEGVEKVLPFFQQRVRWCQGSLQCMHYLPALWRSRHANRFQKVDTAVWIMMPFTGCITPVAGIVALIVLMNRTLADLQFGWHHLAIIAIIAITLIVCVLSANIYLRNYASVHQKIKVGPALLQSLSFQGYLLIVSLTPYFAVYRQIRGNTNWTKTKHGLAKARPVYAKLNDSY